MECPGTDGLRDGEEIQRGMGKEGFEREQGTGGMEGGVLMC